MRDYLEFKTCGVFNVGFCNTNPFRIKPQPEPTFEDIKLIQKAEDNKFLRTVIVGMEIVMMILAGTVVYLI